EEEHCEVSGEWLSAKSNHGLASSAMDELMRMTGLKQIKRQAMAIVKEVLLQRGRLIRTSPQSQALR
ncbi:MAG: hypothetical protein ACPIOQ_39690, partial [Promethearchaeia archaeon]